MAQQLAFIMLAEDHGPVPSIHIVAHFDLASEGIRSAHHTHGYMKTNTYTHKITVNLKSKNTSVQARVNLSATSDIHCFLAMKTFKIFLSSYMHATTYSHLDST